MKTNIILAAVTFFTLFSTVSLSSQKQSSSPGFDCAKAKTKIEISICGTKELADKDAHLNSLYNSVLQDVAVQGKDKLKGEQMRWLKDRNASCERSKYISDCVKDAYDQRIELLRTLKLSAKKHLPYDSFRFEKDPSLIAVKRLPEEPWRSQERYRIVADFNNDDINDIALSYETSMFGNAGGHFSLYLGLPDGRYKEVGSFFAHPAAINLRKTERGESLISTYIRSNAASGVVTEQRLTSEGLFFMKKKAIQSGDFGPKADQALYAELFGPEDGLKAEISETIGDVVKWKSYH